MENAFIGWNGYEVENTKLQDAAHKIQEMD